MAGQTIAHLHGVMRLYANYFQPSFKLLEKILNGSVVTKRYSPPGRGGATPYDRLIRHESVSTEAKAAPAKTEPHWTQWRYCTQSGKPNRRWRRSCPLNSGPRLGARAPHTWRTRKDPFEGVWCDVLGWLQEDPDASAVALLSRLQETEADRFSRAHLRTLQRRVRQWRGIMADRRSTPRPKQSCRIPVECRQWC